LTLLQPRLSRPTFCRLPFAPTGRRRWAIVLLGALAAVAAAPADGPRADDKRQPVPVQPAAGALVIVGGGDVPEKVRDRFLELGGGKKARIVVIPTASERGHRSGSFSSFEYWKVQPVASVVLLHTLQREKANEVAFVKPLTEATAVWLGGGDQSRLISAYAGTAVEKELRKLMARGGVIGGTSAGASAMSKLMIVSGNPEARVGTGFGLLSDVVIDQHFQNRNRLKRLQGILSKNTAYLGLGIDEGTAVVVKGQTATVVGKANVRVCLPPTVKKLPSVQVLKAGQEIDLTALRQAVGVEK
jgi:cyanophycinase